MAVFVATVAVLGVSWLGSSTGRWFLQPVLSSSMAPHIRAGDAVILTRRPSADIVPGEIVAIHNPPGHVGTFIHRAVTVDNRDGHMQLTTKGDANNVVDPWSPIAVNGPTVFSPSAVIPKLGWVLDALAHPVGRNIAAALLAITIMRVLVPKIETERQRNRGPDSKPLPLPSAPLTVRPIPAASRPRPSVEDLLTPIPWATSSGRTLPRRTASDRPND